MFISYKVATNILSTSIVGQFNLILIMEEATLLFSKVKKYLQPYEQNSCQTLLAEPRVYFHLPFFEVLLYCLQVAHSQTKVIR
jgi:hypothetical protein